MDLAGIFSQVWTIARHTIIQALRMRIVLILIAFVVVLLVSMPFLLQSDDTREGQCRMVITYSVWLITFMLSVLTLFLAPASLWNEIKGRQILILDPKPMSRGVLLLGKWCGIMVILTTLLAGMMLTSFLLVWLVVGRQLPREPARAYEAFRTRVFRARRIMRPEFPDDLAVRVDNYMTELKEKNMMPKTQSEDWVRQQLFKQFSRGAWTVAPNTVQSWVVKNVPKTNDWLMLRFTHFGTTAKKEYDIPGVFIINRGAQPTVRVPYPAPDGGRVDESDYLLEGILVRAFRAGKAESFFVTPKVVRDDGTINIEYENHDRRNVSAQFPYMGGMEIHYPAAHLGENYLRVGLIILCHLAFLAILGIFATTFLGLSVAIFLNITVYTVALLKALLFTEMLPKLFLFGTSAQPPWATINQADEIVRGAISKFFMLFPNLLPSGLIDMLANGEVIELSSIGWEFAWLVVVRGGIMAFLAWLIFRQRQLAILSPNA